MIIIITKVMIIVLCDMMLKIHDAQAYLWYGLNYGMAQHGMYNVKFKGLMVDGTQANWKIVCVIYGTSDKLVPMQGNEHSCLLH